MLSIQNLTKRFGDKCAVDNLSLSLAEGEICAFIGHNGAGKTTTLKSIVGLLSIDEGEIFVGGHSVKENAIECKRLLAYIPDNPDLYEFLSGIQYLNFVADVFGVSPEKRSERIGTLGERFELSESLPKPISSYSHGMKQKLAIIAAFLHEPRLILMDEPFVGLDPKASFLLKEMMREHCAGGGTIFFSTHVLEVAEKLCDRVAIIQDGKLVVVGDMESVKGDASLEELFLRLEGERVD